MPSWICTGRRHSELSFRTRPTPVIPTEVLVRLIGLAVVLAVSLVTALPAVEAQNAGKVVTIGILAIEAFPPIDSFRQRLR
jgi:hypothetical protein